MASNPLGQPAPSPTSINLPSVADILVSISLGPGHIVLNWPRWLAAWSTNEAGLNRSRTHLTLLVLVLLAVWLGKIPFSWQQIRTIHPIKQITAVQPAPVAVDQPGAPLVLSGALSNLEDDVLQRAAVPHTIIPERTRNEITTYIVLGGDTIFDIAAKLGLAPETLLWANGDLERNPDWLRVGQELTILPVDGVYHQVGGSDTIAGIAASYKVQPEAILNFDLNTLNPDNPVIVPGQWLIVPGGTKPFVPRTVTAYSGPLPDNATAGSGTFGWPASGSISQGYWSGHPALDIAAWIGAPVNAADSGHVIFAGWDDTGYGYTVVIDHGNGFQTLYAHLNAYYVDAGENVVKGQSIAEIGNTGNSTGPHLHIEIRQGTVQRNPIGFLP